MDSRYDQAAIRPVVGGLPGPLSFPDRVWRPPFPAVVDFRPLCEYFRKVERRLVGVEAFSDFFLLKRLRFSFEIRCAPLGS